jgi:Flp pilus assembly protein TadG
VTRLGRLRDRISGRRAGDSGNAMIEFVFLGIIMLVPLVYLVLAASYVQRKIYGVTEAAREAGRAYATADDTSSGLARAQYAARLAMQDQRTATDIAVGWAQTGGGCAGAVSEPPPLAPGAVFAVCVTRHITVPGMPSFVGARHNTVTGRFVVHVDDYRSFGPGPP